MKLFLALAGTAAAIAVFLAADYFLPGRMVINQGPDATSQELIMRRVREAEERSANAKGVYMTSDVANGLGGAAAKLREDIVAMIDETELNAVVIDIKETRGGTIITNGIKDFVRQLHEKNVWTIARIAVFKDDSQEKIRPEWYLRSKSEKIWRDNRGGSWLDPASPEVWAYQLAVAKAASDAGFDELQFDYIRFPSDGNMAAVVYPSFIPGQPKWGILRAFFGYLHDNLKKYRPGLILSADLFGYVALQTADLGIGQRLQDIGKNFDYISLMVYPSHYYAGFAVPADPTRNLPALNYPYYDKNIKNTSSEKPYDIVYRSLLTAGDILAGRATSAPSGITATTTPQQLRPAGKTAKLRPWLQDFDLNVDTARGIHYDAGKIRAQIKAAEDSGSSGWLLWSPTNIYTKDALLPDARKSGL